MRTRSAASTARRSASTRSKPEGRRAEEAELEPSPFQAADLGAGSALAARRLVELHQVDVPEVEPLGAVDRHHLDRVLRAVLRPPLLGLARLGDAPAQGAQDRREVAAAVLDRGEELPEEAVEVGQAVRPEIAGRLQGFREEQPAQALDEEVGRLALERAAQGGQMLDGGEQPHLPAAQALDPRDVRRHLGGGGLHQVPQLGEPLPQTLVVQAGGRQIGDLAGKAAAPERDQRRVRHADQDRAEDGQQGQVVARDRARRAPGRRPR